MLKLIIKKKWFDMILSLIKKEEYRESKPYYIKRLYNLWKNAGYHGTEEDMIASIKAKGVFSFGDVKFINGYAKNAPTFIANCTLRIGKGNPEWGAEPNTDYFVFGIIEVKKD